VCFIDVLIISGLVSISYWLSKSAAMSVYEAFARFAFRTTITFSMTTVHLFDFVFPSASPSVSFLFGSWSFIAVASLHSSLAASGAVQSSAIPRKPYHGSASFISILSQRPSLPQRANAVRDLVTMKLRMWRCNRD
jgi:hypothetical protein